MSELFRPLGLLLACYAAFGVATGTLYAKSGPLGRSFRRDEDPFQFWCTFVVYCGLAAALVFVF